MERKCTMNFNEVIANRRSIRTYEPSVLTEKQLNSLMQAATLAPSWKNTQTRRYYAALSEDAREYVLEHVLPAGNRNKTLHAAAFIISAAKRGQSGIGDGTFADNIEDGWCLYDLGLADENLLLKATDMGLATLVMGIRDADAARKYFNIPEDEIIMSVIAVGKAGETPKPQTRKEIEEILTVK